MRLALLPALNVTRGILTVATNLVEVSVSGICQKNANNHTIKLEEVEKEFFVIQSEKKRTWASQQKAEARLSATSLSDDEKSLLERKLHSPYYEADDLDRAPTILQPRCDAIFKGIGLRKAALLAFAPIATLVRLLGWCNEQAAPRLLASVLAPKPCYGPPSRARETPLTGPT